MAIQYHIRDTFGNYLPPNLLLRLQSLVMARRLRSVNIHPRLLRLAMLSRDFNSADYEDLLLLDQTHCCSHHKGASTEQLALLPTMKLTRTDEAHACSICLNEMEEGTLVKRLPCMHYFHPECIDQWLKINSTCPLDKKSIVTKEQ